ncbi:ferredoxin-thioredoxin reductase catalytic domain-containing protein [Methanosalsum natronophilum]|uniref:ferredoxin-thioredoxin reductase catalytic domain-containing protein n=1 Tax=Methanosalsum natronophilum TaxID=768733 RepID=UPI00216A4364|nr:ferredoxin-thioredoxin reductase catalytic domain-containing protein [Methanosalsum natronophilum]MCS3924536.1 ferredoxin-thioredoxin reductase catalytic subunit [Methanosalsum natronophilum]
MSERSIEARKKQLMKMFQRVIDPLGYKFNPDNELVDFIMEQEVKLEREAGAPFCPCQALPERREDRMKLVCPCIPYHRKHFDAMKACWCQLYVHKDITDTSQLEQIPITELE